MTFTTPYNYQTKAPRGKRYETPKGFSETIPNQAMSAKELMDRFAAGLPLGGSRVPVYLGEEDPFDGVDISKMDLADRQSLVDKAAEELDAAKRRISEARTKLRETNIEKLKEQIRKEMAAQNPTPPDVK